MLYRCGLETVIAVSNYVSDGLKQMTEDEVDIHRSNNLIVSRSYKVLGLMMHSDAPETVS